MQSWKFTRRILVYYQVWRCYIALISHQHRVQTVQCLCNVCSLIFIFHSSCAVTTRQPLIIRLPSTLLKLRFVFENIKSNLHLFFYLSFPTSLEYVRVYQVDVFFSVRSRFETSRFIKNVMDLRPLVEVIKLNYNDEFDCDFFFLITVFEYSKMA